MFVLEHRFYHWYVPGQRIIKTAVAVTLCLLFYVLRGYRGERIPAEAMITAIICMQSCFSDTKKGSLNRLFGTFLGAVLGFLFLLLVMCFPFIGNTRWLLYCLMGVGTLFALHSAVVLKQPDASGLSAIVFICVVISYPDIENPLDQAFHRMCDVFVGTTIATIVNAVRLPRVRHSEKIFFVPVNRLVSHRFEEFSSFVLFQLQRLVHDGAKICLISDYAPAFQMMMFGKLDFTVPMIVMDGGAIYDPNENEYLSVSTLCPNSCRWLIKCLSDVNYFVYTIHKDRNCIYHHGQLTELEDKVYRHLKKSPYRYYLDDDHFSVSDVVCFKIVSTSEEVNRLQRALEPMLDSMKLRSVVRHQVGVDEGYSLYIFAKHADVEHAIKHVVKLVQKDDNKELDPHVFEPNGDTVSDKDAMKVIREIRNEFEPYWIVEFGRNVWRRIHGAK